MGTDKGKMHYEDYKLIANGHVLEVYKYEKGVCVGHNGNGGGRRAKDEEKSNREEEIRKTSSRKARNEVRRQTLANFSEHSKFITLTFRDGSVKDVTDVQECNYAFKKFIGRLRYWLKKNKPDKAKFKYLAVIEFQDKNDRGAVHYHMISDLPYIPHEELTDIWRHGWVGINDIKHVDNIGAYLVKYMLKDVNDNRLKGNKAYLSSKGLNKSSTVRGNIVEKILESYGISEDTKKEFANSYISEHHGQISYTEYNLKRMKK